MAMIYGKTAKGLAEIPTRAHRLTPRMRGALILIDGRRDVDEVKRLVGQQADETLRALVEQGFIEALGAAPPADVTKAATVADQDIVQTRRAAVRALTDLIGPAAESLSIRIEKARDFTELEPLLQQAVQTIATMRSRAAAQAYAARFGVA